MAPSRTARNARSDDADPLNPRGREILKDIIYTHILSGEPVSSRAVSKHAEHSLSAASIRNVMADLEDSGWLAQPHSSAGRVPTQAAYRLYVESLMQMRRLSSRERAYIEEYLLDASNDTDHLLNAATHLLSELSDQVGVVLTPSVEEIVLKSMDFVSLGPRKVLCVMVSTSGFLDHLVIEIEDEISREELVRISNYVTSQYAGTGLLEIRDQLLRLMDAERAHVDRWLASAIDLARRAIGGSGGQGVIIEGTSSLLGKPELADLDQVRLMLDTFADKARLVKMLNKCLTGDGVRVFLGEDSDVTSELDFSLVATTYGVGQTTLGSLGIIGPARMEYPRMVPLVRFLGETLSRALASGSTG
ncbi:MAG: heat-inducible transcriptional repressor HrcA [Acidobacteriota bacterium]